MLDVREVCHNEGDMLGDKCEKVYTVQVACK